MALNLKTDSIIKLFFSYFLPALFTMLALSTYNVVDGVFVGKKFGEDALAAIGICWPIFPAFIAFELLFGFGGAAIVSYFLGANKANRARLVFSSIFYFVLISSIIISLVCFINTESIINLLTAKKELPSQIKTLAFEYLQVIFLGCSLFILHPLSEIFVVNDKRPILGSIAMAIGSVMNIILNYLFLFIFDMGIEGSALATVSAHLIAFSILITHFLFKKGELYFIPRFSINAIISSAKSGLPESFSEISASITMLLYNTILIGIAGALGVQVYGILMYCGIIFFTIILSISQAMQPLSSFNYGAGDFKRLKQILGFALIMSIVISIVVYVLFYLFDKYLIMLFLRQDSSDYDLILNSTIEAMNYYFLGYILLGINITFGIFLQSVQRTFSSIIITISYTILFLAILLPIMSKISGLNGAWLSFPAAQACALVVSILVMIYENKYGIFSGNLKGGKIDWKKRN